MMQTTELRDYQLSMLQDLYKAWKRTHSVMVQMPTGTGKTHLMAAVIRSLTPGPSPIGEGSIYLSGKALIVAHRRELIAQISQTLDRFGVEHGVIVSGQEIDYSQKVQVASIQTLSRRIDTIQGPLPKKRGRKSAADIEAEKTMLDFSLVIIDEAHHALADTYRMLWDKWPNARFLGLTATPCRLSGAPFTDLFDLLVQSWSVREFIDKGWLSDLDYISVKPDSLAVRKVAGIDKRGTDGDYQTKQAALVLDTKESIAHLYQSYSQYANGRKGIVYAINREHAQHITDYYQEHGVRCAVIDSMTPLKERERIVKEYRSTQPQSLTPSFSVTEHKEGMEKPTSGEPTSEEPTPGLDVLVNCEVFGEGVDVVDVEFIQLARPTLSLALFQQQVGRGMRVSEGKDKVIILDQVGLYFSLGLPTADRDWQGMFLGEIKGKGISLASYRMTSIEMAVSKMLVNEEMVRLTDFERMKAELQQEWDRQQQQKAEEEKREQRNRKARERWVEFRLAKEAELANVEWHGQIGVFRSGGKFGIRRRSEICLPAVYEKIEVLYAWNSPYFAAALLPTEKAGGSRLWTIITKDGRDLHARIEGSYYEVRDDVFIFRQADKGRLTMQLWDAKYDRYYTNVQRQKIGGVEFFVDDSGEYTLRSKADFKGVFASEYILFNDRITIIDNELFVKGEPVAHYHIKGYKDGCIIVEDGDSQQGGWLQLSCEGSVDKHITALPEGMTAIPLLRNLGLRRELRLTHARDNVMPRDYQQEMLDGLMKAFKHSKKVLLQVPLGSGKPFIVSRVIREERRQREGNSWRNNILIVAHRPEVKEQISQTLDRYGLIHSVYGSRHPWKNGRDALVVVDTESISKFISESHFFPLLIIIDEVQAVGNELFECLSWYYPDVRLLGLSSTPCFEHEKQSPRVFKKLLPSWSLKRLIASGWLRDVDVVTVEDNAKEGQLSETDGPSHQKVRKKPKDTNAEVLYHAYKKYADGKKGIVFASDGRHAKEIADGYMQHGIRSEVIDFKDKTIAQDYKLNGFEAGVVKVLVCTDYFSDGMRCPDADFVQLAADTDSLNTYLHQVGCAMHPGKDEEYGEYGISLTLRRLTVLDHAGLTEKFGMPTDERDWMKLFAGVKKPSVRKKNSTDKKKAAPTPTEPQAAAQTKWQLRMQRLLGNTPPKKAGDANPRSSLP